jgi:4'-phosphopantetheinyl transferase
MKESTVDLWLTYSADVDNEALDSYRSLLSIEEREAEQALRVAAVRTQYLVTRAQLRTVLSSYVDLRPQDWTFRKGKFGKPEVANSVAVESRISFNISHSDGLISLVVDRGCELGVDVENFAERAAPIDHVKAFLSQKEARALIGLPSRQRQARFFEYWTLKEAYLKAKGIGLSFPPNGFGFDLSRRAEIRFETHGTDESDPREWRFVQLSLSRKHLVSICRDCSSSRPNLVCRLFTPLRRARVIWPKITRMSADWQVW